MMREMILYVTRDLVEMEDVRPVGHQCAYVWKSEQELHTDQGSDYSFVFLRRAETSQKTWY